MTESELHTLPAAMDLDLAVATRRVEAALFDVAPLVRLGRYVLLQRVGAGAMGIVYAAHDPELDRKVAIKVLQPQRETNLEQAPARLVREARALVEVGLDTPRGVLARLALAEDLIATGELDEARQHAEASLAVIERLGGPRGTRERARAVLAHRR